MKRIFSGLVCYFKPRFNFGYDKTTFQNDKYMVYLTYQNKKTEQDMLEMTDYLQLEKELCALSDGIKHPVSVLSNASALLWQ